MKTDGSNAVQLLLFIGGISLVPALLFTVTGFTRILIVLSFIRTGLGTPTAPPNQVLVGIAFFLTLFVMTPTLKTIKHDAYDPMQKGAITQEVALKRAEAPLREFMFNQTRDKDIALFVKLSGEKPSDVKTRRDVPTQVLIPAFIISELKTAFQIGFLIFLPFLIIDLVVELHVDVDGDDDAPTGLHLAPVQDPAVHPRGRLEPRHFVARSSFHMS